MNHIKQDKMFSTTTELDFEEYYQLQSSFLRMLFKISFLFAPLGNPDELFRKGSTLDRNQSVKRIDF